MTVGSLGFVAAGAASPSAPDAPLEVVFVADPTTPDLVTVEVRGLSSETLAGLRSVEAKDRRWRSVLAVSVGSADGATPTLLGRWQVDGSTLRFRPQFPVAPGLELVARFDNVALHALAGSASSHTPDETSTPLLTARHRVPDLRRDASTRVTAVYPSQAVVPANLLRFYVHFSAPMSARHVVPHVRLLDAEGHVVPTAFVEIPEGLWDPARQRLTLLVHPGRVKRGVGPNVALGPVLEAGRDYRLEIDGQALDAQGLPLVAPWVHRFSTGPTDHQRPDPSAWRLDLPTVETRGPLVVTLPQPADRALLERLPRLDTRLGEPVPGRVEVAESETRWHFVPAEPWRPGDYRLRVPHLLEDPSGNRVDRHFEEGYAAEEQPRAAASPAGPNSERSELHDPGETVLDWTLPAGNSRP